MLSEANTRSLDRLLIDTGLADRVEGIRIWLRDGRIAYSTDKSLTGKTMPSDDIEGAFTGTVTSEVMYSPDEEHAGQTMDNYPLLEVYAPIYREGTDEVIAAGEFYEKADGFLAVLSASRRATWLIVGATTAGMMGLLYMIVRGASDLIVSQQKLLRDRIESAQALSAQNGKLRQAAELARMNASKSNEDLLNTIGADIHDGPVQLLSALLLKPRDVDLVQQLARQVLDELREISGGLVLPEIEGLPLKSALQLAVQRHRNTTGTDVGERYGLLPDTVSHPLKICLYRVVQEALNNASRHGRGQGQHVEAVMDGRVITVAVSDGGPGLNGEVTSDPTSKQLGLNGIRNRVDAFGGSMEISSRKGKGTILMARVPLDGNGA